MWYYIHGYLSSPDGTKGRLFKEKLHTTPIKYRNGKPEDLIIRNCLERIDEAIKDDDNVILIGSSLGGFLAAETALNNKKVETLFLLNPAIIPPYIDISDIQGMPQRILRDMKDEKLFTIKIQADIYIILGTEDEVVPNSWGIEFAKAQEAQVLFLQDDHRLSRNIENLPDIILKLYKK
ncbi:MAG: hypothetical protein DRN12_02205 [Thermoplasmata archaeon]|nr:MAG: hypothetical protein DRN12_02205 [Thermoplasmata archaeon]HEC88989.1 hypothetical protein [Thermoplasmatales archaeon]